MGTKSTETTSINKHQIETKNLISVKQSYLFFPIYCSELIDNSHDKYQWNEIYN
jgi:hypothetical protein